MAVTKFYDTMMKFLSGINKRAHEREFGLQGGEVLTSGSVHSGKWQAIKADGGAGTVVFTSLSTERGDDLNGFKLNAGDVLYGEFTSMNIDAAGDITTVYAYSKN